GRPGQATHCLEEIARASKCSSARPGPTKTGSPGAGGNLGKLEEPWLAASMTARISKCLPQGQRDKGGLGSRVSKQVARLRAGASSAGGLELEPGPQRPFCTSLDLGKWLSSFSSVICSCGAACVDAAVLSSHPVDSGCAAVDQLVSARDCQLCCQACVMQLVFSVIAAVSDCSVKARDADPHTLVTSLSAQGSGGGGTARRLLLAAAAAPLIAVGAATAGRDCRWRAPACRWPSGLARPPTTSRAAGSAGLALDGGAAWSAREPELGARSRGGSQPPPLRCAAILPFPPRCCATAGPGACPGSRLSGTGASFLGQALRSPPTLSSSGQPWTHHRSAAPDSMPDPQVRSVSALPQLRFRPVTQVSRQAGRQSQARRRHPQPLPGRVLSGRLALTGDSPGVPHSGGCIDVPQQQVSSRCSGTEVEWTGRSGPTCRYLTSVSDAGTAKSRLAHRGSAGERVSDIMGTSRLISTTAPTITKEMSPEAPKQLQVLPGYVAGGARLPAAVSSRADIVSSDQKQRLEHRPVRLASTSRRSAHQEDRGKVQHVLQHRLSETTRVPTLPAMGNQSGCCYLCQAQAIGGIICSAAGEGVPKPMATLRPGEAPGHPAGGRRRPAVEVATEAGQARAGGLRADQSGHVEAGGAHAGADVGAASAGRPAAAHWRRGGAEAQMKVQRRRQAGQDSRATARWCSSPKKPVTRANREGPSRHRWCGAHSSPGRRTDEDEEQSLQRQAGLANPGGAGRAETARLGDAVAEVAGRGDQEASRARLTAKADGCRWACRSGRSGTAGGGAGPVQHELSGLVRQRLPQFPGRRSASAGPADPLARRRPAAAAKASSSLVQQPSKQQHQRAAAPERTRQQELPRPAAAPGGPAGASERRDQRRQEALGVQPAQARVLAQRSAQRAAAGGQAVRERQPLASLPHQVAHQLGVAASTAHASGDCTTKAGGSDSTCWADAPRRLVGGLEGWRGRHGAPPPAASPGQRSTAGWTVRNAPCGEVTCRTSTASLSYRPPDSLCPAKQSCCYRPEAATRWPPARDDLHPGGENGPMVLITLLPVLTALLPGIGGKCTACSF
uniref:Protein kinase domain-containing protein n=1 Tax=Macrostomum lignano TaxID=282301 RepID=A0A1I8FM99_9PLAT